MTIAGWGVDPALVVQVCDELPEHIQEQMSKLAEDIERLAHTILDVGTRYVALNHVVAVMTKDRGDVEHGDLWNAVQQQLGIDKVWETVAASNGWLNHGWDVDRDHLRALAGFAT